MAWARVQRLCDNELIGDKVENHMHDFLTSNHISSK
jgi:hypothetical protein